jgi:hypothetical protein
MKMAVYWGVAPCILIEIDRRFGGPYRLHYHDNKVLMMEAVSISETAVSFYKATRRSIPEDSLLQADKFIDMAGVC